MCAATPPALQLRPLTRCPALHARGPQEEKRRRTALREARIAFLEEEVPALVARGAELSVLRRKMADVNKRLGDKFEISEAELQGTYDACRQLLEAGEVSTHACSYGEAPAQDRWVQARTFELPASLPPDTHTHTHTHANTRRTLTPARAQAQRQSASWLSRRPRTGVTPQRQVRRSEPAA